MFVAYKIENTTSWTRINSTKNQPSHRTLRWSNRHAKPLLAISGKSSQPIGEREVLASNCSRSKYLQASLDAVRGTRAEAALSDRSSSIWRSVVAFMRRSPRLPAGTRTCCHGNDSFVEVLLLRWPRRFFLGISGGSSAKARVGNNLDDIIVDLTGRERLLWLTIRIVSFFFFFFSRAESRRVFSSKISSCPLWIDFYLY